MMMTDEQESLIAHLKDLEEKSQTWHKSLCSDFMNEEEVAMVQPFFPSSGLIRYDGGYEGARKQKVFFLKDEGDTFNDIICLKAKIDQRFRKISHRDILGAIMHLQVERSSFGDFWIEDNTIYLYTSEKMKDFFMNELTRINQLRVSWEVSDDHPVQHFQMKEIQCVSAGDRLDSLVAAITHKSRSISKDLIKEGYVSVNHVPVVQPDKLCNNNSTISIRGYGRFLFVRADHETRSGKIVAVFRQYI